MDALKRSISESKTSPAKSKTPRKAAAGQKEMLLPISGKRAAKEDRKKVEKPTPARARKSGLARTLALLSLTVR
jgi:DNA end-binding protein Ku